MGLDDEDRSSLENKILENPKVGAVIKNTGGLRKMRFAVEGKGKSGGARVLYVDYVVYEKVYLITAYPKGAKDNISDKDKMQYKQLIEKIGRGLSK